VPAISMDAPATPRRVLAPAVRRHPPVVGTSAVSGSTPPTGEDVRPAAHAQGLRQREIELAGSAAACSQKKTAGNRRAGFRGSRARRGAKVGRDRSARNCGTMFERVGARDIVAEPFGVARVCTFEHAAVMDGDARQENGAGVSGRSACRARTECRGERVVAPEIAPARRPKPRTRHRTLVVSAGPARRLTARRPADRRSRLDHRAALMAVRTSRTTGWDHG